MQTTESPMQIECFLKAYPSERKNAVFIPEKTLETIATPELGSISNITDDHIMITDAQPIQMTVSFVDNGLRSSANNEMMSKSENKNKPGFFQEVDLLLDISPDNLDLVAKLTSNPVLGIVLIKRQNDLAGFYQIGSKAFPATLKSTQANIYGIKLTYISWAEAPFYIYNGNVPEFENEVSYVGGPIYS